MLRAGEGRRTHKKGRCHVLCSQLRPGINSGLNGKRLCLVKCFVTKQRSYTEQVPPALGACVNLLC